MTTFIAYLLGLTLGLANGVIWTNIYFIRKAQNRRLTIKPVAVFWACLALSWACVAGFALTKVGVFMGLMIGFTFIAGVYLERSRQGQS